MNEMMSMMADTLPREAIISHIRDAIEKYSGDPNDDNWKHLAIICSMLLTKFSIEETSLEGFREDMDMIDRTQNLLNPDKN